MSRQRLSGYLASRRGLPRPTKGDLPDGEATVRIDILELVGGCLGTADPGQAPFGVTVNCSPGRYVLTADCVAYGSDIRVARARAVREGVEVVSRRKRGTIPVDLAMASFFDAQRLAQFALEDEAGFDDWVEEHVVMCDWHATGAIRCAPARTRIVYFPAGFGDGTYTVFVLRGADGIAGLEVEFIDRDAPYPFDLSDLPEHGSRELLPDAGAEAIPSVGDAIDEFRRLVQAAGIQIPIVAAPAQPRMQAGLTKRSSRRGPAARAADRSR